MRTLEVGWEKVAYWSTKAAISLKRVKVEEKLLWKSPTLFRFFWVAAIFQLPNVTCYDIQCVFGNSMHYCTWYAA